MDILQYIPYGRNNAISRERLRDLTGLSDRDIRELISNARRDTIILNLQDGRGYFRPEKEDAELVRLYVSQEESRLKSIGWALRAARRGIKNEG